MYKIYCYQNCYIRARHWFPIFILYSLFIFTNCEKFPISRLTLFRLHNFKKASYSQIWKGNLEFLLAGEHFWSQAHIKFY
jgi:hypothetical protein